MVTGNISTGTVITVLALAVLGILVRIAIPLLLLLALCRYLGWL